MKAKPAEISIRRTEITIETVSVTRIRRATVGQTPEPTTMDEDTFMEPTLELAGERSGDKEL